MIFNRIQLEQFLALIVDKYPMYECNGQRSFDVKINGKLLNHKTIYFMNDVDDKGNVKMGIRIDFPIDTEELERMLSKKLAEFNKEISSL